jgi:hypothetical protein
MKNIKNNFLFLCFGIVLGIALALTLQKSWDGATSAIADSASATSVDYAQQVCSMEATFNLQQDSLKEVANRLEVDLGSTKTKLKTAVHRSQHLQLQMYDLLDTRFQKQFTDSSGAPSPCDSMMESISAYIDANQEKDSLQAEVQKTLEGQLTVKDDQLQLQTVAYNQLHSAFDSTILQNQDLLQNNQRLEKGLKKQRTRTRIVAAALVFITGLGANYLLHH